MRNLTSLCMRSSSFVELEVTLKSPLILPDVALEVTLNHESTPKRYGVLGFAESPEAEAGNGGKNSTSCG